MSTPTKKGPTLDEQLEAKDRRDLELRRELLDAAERLAADPSAEIPPELVDRAPAATWRRLVENAAKRCPLERRLSSPIALRKRRDVAFQELSKAREEHKEGLRVLDAKVAAKLRALSDVDDEVQIDRDVRRELDPLERARDRFLDKGEL